MFTLPRVTLLTKPTPHFNYDFKHFQYSFKISLYYVRTTLIIDNSKKYTYAVIMGPFHVTKLQSNRRV